MILRLARTTSARYLVLLGAVVGAGRLLLAPWWRGSWADATLAATSTLVLLFPFLMLAGTLDGRRLLRTGAQPSVVTSARRPIGVIAQLAAVVGGWGLGAYLVILLTGYAAPARLNPLWPPPIPLVWIAAGAGAVLGYAALGVLLGRLLPVLVAVALCGLLGFVLPVVLGAEVDWTPALFTVANDGFLGGPSAPRTATLLLQAMFFVLVAVATVALTALLVRRTPAAATGTAMLGVLAVGGGIVLALVGQTKTVWLVNQAGPPVCTADRVVCVWRDHAFLREPYAEVGRRMLAGAPPTLPVGGWTETGLYHAPSKAEVFLSAGEPEPANVALALAGGLVDRLAPNRRPHDGLDPAETWLAARGLDPADRARFLAAFAFASPQVAEVLARPVEQQWSWFLTEIG